MPGMKTYISILRGINVSGKNIIKMNSLLEMYEGKGFKHVTTYIQSGNVIFQSEETNIAELEESISEEIAKRFKFNVPVLIREASDLKHVLAQNPFLEKGDIDHLYITLLSRSPESHFLQSIQNITYLPDGFVIKDRAVFLKCPNGYGRTKLNNNFFENKLKVSATTRNLKTLTELVKISELL
jgi:uncharacterized protein (DUF1697 family)